MFAIFSLGKCVSLGKCALAILVGGSMLGTFVCHLSLGKGLFASLVWGNVSLPPEFGEAFAILVWENVSLPF